MKTKSKNRLFYRYYSDFKPDSYTLDLKKANLNVKLRFIEGVNAQYDTFHEILIINI